MCPSGLSRMRSTLSPLSDIKNMNILFKIEQFERPKQCGDWHDKPLRWRVFGVGFREQWFATKRESTIYARCLRLASTQKEADRMWSDRVDAIDAKEEKAKKERASIRFARYGAPSRRRSRLAVW